MPEKHRSNAVQCLEYVVSASPEAYAELKKEGKWREYLNGAIKWVEAKQGGTIVQANMAATVWGKVIYEGRGLYKTGYWLYIHHVVITEWLPEFLAERGGLFLCSDPYTGAVGRHMFIYVHHPMDFTMIHPVG